VQSEARDGVRQPAADGSLPQPPRPHDDVRGCCAALSLMQLSAGWLTSGAGAAGAAAGAAALAGQLPAQHQVQHQSRRQTQRASLHLRLSAPRRAARGGARAARRRHSSGRAKNRRHPLHRALMLPSSPAAPLLTLRQSALRLWLSGQHFAFCRCLRARPFIASENLSQPPGALPQQLRAFDLLSDIVVDRRCVAVSPR
jgi:hypothetical protein